MLLRPQPRPFPYPLHIGVDICHIQRFRDILFRKPLEAAHRDALRDRQRRAGHNGRASLDLRLPLIDFSRLMRDNSGTSLNRPSSSFLGDTKQLESDDTVDTLEPIDWTLHDEMRALDPPPAEPLHPLNSPPASVSELLGPYPLLRRFMTRSEQAHFCINFGRDLRESAERAKQRLPPTPVSEARITRRAASMWAVKEAAIKAVKPRRILMRDVDVFMRDLDKASYGNGAPYAVVRARREGDAGQVVRVSLSHDGDFAVACVLAVEDMGDEKATRHVGWETAARQEDMEAMGEMGEEEEETEEEV